MHGSLVDRNESGAIILKEIIRALSGLYTGIRKRIDNPVKFRNGTATVSAEAVYEAKAGHWATEKTVHGLMMRKSGDLLEEMCYVDPGSGETGEKTAEKRLRQLR